MNRCGSIILAAGSSSRMGKPKQLMTYKGQCLLQHAVSVGLEATSPVVVVLGAHADEVMGRIGHEPAQIVHNVNWEEGMASSIRCGLTKLLEHAPSTEYAIFMTCDQPYIHAGLLQALLQEQARSGKAIVACAYDDTAGIPALFHKSLFGELMALKGDMGARRIIKQDADRMSTVPFPLGAIDIDTPEDYSLLNED